MNGVLTSRITDHGTFTYSAHTRRPLILQAASARNSISMCTAGSVASR